MNFTGRNPDRFLSTQISHWWLLVFVHWFLIGFHASVTDQRIHLFPNVPVRGQNPKNPCRRLVSEPSCLKSEANPSEDSEISAHLIQDLWDHLQRQSQLHFHLFYPEQPAKSYLQNICRYQEIGSSWLRSWPLFKFINWIGIFENVPSIKD